MKLKPATRHKHAQKTASTIVNQLIASGWIKLPPGHVVVPYEPTPEQLFAGVEAAVGFTGSDAARLRAQYVAMMMPKKTDAVKH